MAEELTWRVGWEELRPDRVSEGATAVVAKLPGLSFEVEVEERDCVSLFFKVPEAYVAAAGGWDPPEGDGDTFTIEISFYDLDGDGCVFCLEDEWSDNESAWDAACKLAEDLAEVLDADAIDLE